MAERLIDDKKLAPDPSTEEKVRVLEIARQHLGPKATAGFLDGVRAKGNKGDGAFYAEVILVQCAQPLPREADALTDFYEKLEAVRSHVSSEIGSSGSMIIDITPGQFGLGGEIAPEKYVPTVKGSTHEI